MRLFGLLTFIAPLVAADLWLKSESTTPAWTSHQRGVAWVVLCFALVPFVLFVTRIPSSLVPPAAGLLLAGILGNLLSALSNGLLVANPILVRGERTELAFNLADLYAIVGIVVLVAAVCGWLIQHRSALPTATDADKLSRRGDWGSDRRPLT